MAIKRSKRYKQAVALLEKGKRYPLKDAIALLKKLPTGKSDETVELTFNLGVDPRQSDQMVRGTVALPHGSGKKVRVLVFATGKAASEAKEAGADYVGFEDLIKQVSGGFQDFDVAVATPEAMSEVRKLGKVLGPRGLMPNPKTGTVTDDAAKAVRECKAGRVEFKIDKTSNISVVCGKASFDEVKLLENTSAVLAAITRAKPSTSKGQYIKTCVLASTYSPGIAVDAGSVTAN
ncbi:MAG: 50S ribosomal protein L1 [Verrucomicrobiales bacterium]|jgi:large subunit ribosomal protein L1|nr:50S ribosomal protein L1 [Verrucomicrobiales bacterium]